jgi:hypothetical protein
MTALYVVATEWMTHGIGKYEVEMVPGSASGETPCPPLKAIRDSYLPSARRRLVPSPCFRDIRFPRPHAHSKHSSKRVTREDTMAASLILS